MTDAKTPEVAVLTSGVREEVAAALRLWTRQKFGRWITWKTAWTAAQEICAPAAARIVELEASLDAKDALLRKADEALKAMLKHSCVAEDHDAERMTRPILLKLTEAQK